MHVRHILLLVSLIVLLTSCSDKITVWLDQVNPGADHDETVLVGRANQGMVIFTQGANGAPPCATCHQTSAGASGFSIGPNLSGVHDRAASRIEGFTAEAYVENSILNPADFVVSGYQNVMFPQYAEYYSPQEVADLIAYVLSL